MEKVCLKSFKILSEHVLRRRWSLQGSAGLYRQFCVVLNFGNWT